MKSRAGETLMSEKNEQQENVGVVNMQVLCAKKFIIIIIMKKVRIFFSIYLTSHLDS